MSCNNEIKRQNTKNEDKVLLTYKVIKINEGWGYDILIDHKIYVHQDYIPAIQGLHPFISVEDAEKTAKLAAEKIKKGILPPSISVEEIDSLGVYYPRE